MGLLENITQYLFVNQLNINGSRPTIIHSIAKNQLYRIFDDIPEGTKFMFNFLLILNISLIPSLSIFLWFPSYGNNTDTIALAKLSLSISIMLGSPIVRILSYMHSRIYFYRFLPRILSKCLLRWSVRGKSKWAIRQIIFSILRIFFFPTRF